MSTAKRARHHSLHLDLSNGVLDSLPPVAAVFLILFDVKAGYASCIQELATLLMSEKVYHSLEQVNFWVWVDLHIPLSCPSSNTPDSGHCRERRVQVLTLGTSQCPRGSNVKKYMCCARCILIMLLDISFTMMNMPELVHSSTNRQQNRSAMR